MEVKHGAWGRNPVHMENEDKDMISSGLKQKNSANILLQPEIIGDIYVKWLLYGKLFKNLKT